MAGYLGAKSGSGVYQKIINVMPPHVTYIEAFLGTGEVMKRKPPAQYNIGIDKYQQMIDEFDYAADELLCTDAINYLDNFTPKNQTCIYADPPYVHNTRTSNARYKHEMTDDDHIKLLTTLDALNNDQVYVILSGYKNDIYDSMLGHWWSDSFQAMTRGGVRTETIWCNFQPGEIHYHTYAGDNFTDRQRIQRKALRWAAKYKKLPPGERQAIMAAMLAVS